MYKYKQSTKKFMFEPNVYREQLIGADKRSIDRTLLREDGSPRCITMKHRNNKPVLVIRFNTYGWPKKHQSFFERERRVYNIEHCREVYLEAIKDANKTLQLPLPTVKVLTAAWQEFITAYDHYIV